MSGLRVPANKMDKQHWENFLSYLERTQRGQLIANNAAATTTIDLNDDSSDVPSIAKTHNTTEAEAIDLLKRCRLGETENVVVLSSDSENDDETIWSSYAKCKGYKRLWERARCIVFHRLIPKYYHCTGITKEPYFYKTAEEQLFPYNKLKELAEELRKFQQDFMHNEQELEFLWKSVLQWLLAINQSLYPMDFKYDEKFNLILIDFMVQYVNYITSIYINITDEAKINSKIQEIVQTLTVILNANTLHVLMVLLRIDLKLEYRAILDPVFRKYLTEQSLCHASGDLVVYLQLIFCFKRWKMITPLKTDRESINELAVGKSLRKLRRKSVTEVTDLTTESILPKSVPKVNENNKFFVLISDLIGFAIERKAFGTRILLVYTSLDLEDAISKYLQFYERYISCNPGFGTPDATATSAINTDIMLPQDKDSSLTAYRNNRDATPCQQQLPSQQKKKAAQVLEKQPKNSKSSHETHFNKNCDKNKNRLSYSPSCSVSRVSRKHTTNTKSDISLSSLSTSLNNDIEYTQIDLTDSDDDDREHPKSKQNTTLTNISGSYNTHMNLNSLSSPQAEPQSVKIQTTFSRREREKKPKENINQTTEIKTNTKNTESTIILTSSSSSSSDDGDNSLIKYLKNSDSDTVSRQSSIIPNDNALALEQSMPRIAAIPPRCRPLVESVATKPTRKEKHCIPGEVSSTTSPDCGLQTNITQSPQAAQERETTSTNFQYNVSNLEVHSAGTLQNAREVGIVKAVQQRVSPCPPVVVSGTCKPGSLLLGIDYSDFSSDNEDLDSECGSHILAHGSWKVVEEATSSTAEIPKTLTESIVFSTRSDRSRIKSRVNSAEKNILHRNIPIDETESQFSAPSSLPDDSPESVDRPTCSKYIVKTSTNSAVRKSCPIQRISKDKNKLATTLKTDSLLKPAVPAFIKPNCIETSKEEGTGKEEENEDQENLSIAKKCELNVPENSKNDKDKVIDSGAPTIVEDHRSNVVLGIIDVNCQLNITDVIPAQSTENDSNFNLIDDGISKTKKADAKNEASLCSITSSDPVIQNKLENTALDKTSNEQNKLLKISNNESVAINLKSHLNMLEDDKIPSDETDESTEAADIESFLKEIDENLNETIVSNNNRDGRIEDAQPEEINRQDYDLNQNTNNLLQKSKSSIETITPLSPNSIRNMEPSETLLCVDTNTKATADISIKKAPTVTLVSFEVDITKDSLKNKESTKDKENVEVLKLNIGKNEPLAINSENAARIEAVVTATPANIVSQINANKISQDTYEKRDACGSEVKLAEEEEIMNHTEDTFNTVQSKEDQNSKNILTVVPESEIATVDNKMLVPTEDASSFNVVKISNELLDMNEKNAETISTDEEELRPVCNFDNTYQNIIEAGNKITESKKDEELMPLSDSNKISDNSHQEICERRTNSDTVSVSSITSNLEYRDKSDINEIEMLKVADSGTSSIGIKNVENSISKLNSKEYKNTNTVLENENKVPVPIEVKLKGVEANCNETCVAESAEEQMQNILAHTSESEVIIKERALENDACLVAELKDKNNKVCSNLIADNLVEKDLLTADNIELNKFDISEENTIKKNSVHEDVNPLDENGIDDSKKIQANQVEVKNVMEDVKSKEDDNEHSTENHLSEPIEPNDINDTFEYVSEVHLSKNTLIETKPIPEGIESSCADDNFIENSSIKDNNLNLHGELNAKNQIDIVEESILTPAKIDAIELSNRSNNDDAINSRMASSPVRSTKVITEIISEDIESSEEQISSSKIYEERAAEGISECLNIEKSFEEINIQQENNKASLLENSAELKTVESDENKVKVLIGTEVNTEENVEYREIPENNGGKTSTHNIIESTSEMSSERENLRAEKNKSGDSGDIHDVNLIGDNLILKSGEEKISEILNTNKDKTTHVDNLTDKVMKILTQNRDETSINTVNSAISITDEAVNHGLSSEKGITDDKMLEEVALEDEQKLESHSEDITTKMSVNNEIPNSLRESICKNLDEVNKTQNTIKLVIEEEFETSNSKDDGTTIKLDNQVKHFEKTINEPCEKKQDHSEAAPDAISCQKPIIGIQEDIPSTLGEAQNILDNKNQSQEPKLGIQDDIPSTLMEAQNIKENEKSQSEQISQETNENKSHNNCEESQEIDLCQNLLSAASITDPCGDTSENEALEIENALEHSQSSKSSNASGRGTPLLDEELHSVHGTEHSGTLKNTVSTVFKNLKEHACIPNVTTTNDSSKTADNDAETKSSKQISTLEDNTEAHSKILPLMEDDVEKRTPFKMRLKRRISLCSDINKEFNLDIKEDEEEKHRELYINNSFTAKTDTKDTDEQAENISKLHIKTPNTSSEGDRSQAENDLDDLQNSLLSNLGLFKRTRRHLATETIQPNAVENMDILDKFEGRRKKQKVVKHVPEVNPPPQLLKEVPINYNFEEIAAITALMNMQNKCSKKNDDEVPELHNKDEKANNAVTTEATRRSRLCKTKASNRNCASKRGQVNATTTNTTTTTAIITKPIKTILKTTLQRADDSSKCKIKKKVTYDETSTLPLEKNSETRKTRKSYCNLKTMRSEEGALKGGNKRTKKRLAEINARFKEETMSSINDSNDATCNSVSDNNNESSSMALRNKSKILEVPEKPPPLPRRQSLENTVSRLAERIKCQDIKVELTVTCNKATPEGSVTTLEKPVEITKPRRGRKKKIPHESTDDKNNQIMPAILKGTSSSKSPCSNKNTRQEVSIETVKTVQLTSKKCARNSTQNKSTKPNNTETSMSMQPIAVLFETPFNNSKIPTYATESSVTNIVDELNIVEQLSQVAEILDLPNNQGDIINPVCELKTLEKLKEAEMKVKENEPEEDKEFITKSKFKRLWIETVDLQSSKNNLKLKKAFVKMKRVNVPKQTATLSEVVSSKTEDTSSLLQEYQIKTEPTEETTLEFPSFNAIDFKIKTEDESLDAIDKFSPMHNDFSFTDTDAETKNQKSCKEIIVRPCDVILTAEIITAQAYRLTEIARERRKLTKISYCDVPARRKTAIASKVTGKNGPTEATATPDFISISTIDNKNQRKKSANPKRLNKPKPLCKLKEHLFVNVCENEEQETSMEKQNAQSQALKESIEPVQITLSDAPKTISTVIDICKNKEEETLRKKANISTLTVGNESMMESNDNTTMKDDNAISIEEICERNEKEILMDNENTFSQTQSHPRKESDVFTSTKDLTNKPHNTLCQNREKENTPSQVLGNTSIETGVITSAKELNITPAENISQNKRKRTSKKAASSQILNHQSVELDDITALNSLRTETEEVYKDKANENVIGKKSSPSKISSNGSIKCDVTLTKDRTTLSTQDDCENIENKILVQMEHETSQELNDPYITPAENISQKNRKKTSKKAASRQILSHPSIQRDNITSSLKTLSKEEACKNNENENVTEKEIKSYKVPTNESIETVDITLTKDPKTMPFEDVCVNRENQILVEMEKSSESIESGNITSSNEPNVIPTVNISQKKRKNTSKKTASSQIPSHPSIQPDEITSSNSLRSISNEEPCKNNEKVIEKENTSFIVPSNEIIETVDITLTKDRKTIPTEDACENRGNKILVEMEHATSQVWNEPNITPAENISQKNRKKTSKKAASSQILSNPNTQRDNILSSNSLRIITSEEVCKNNENENVIEKENKSCKIPSNESIETVDITLTKDRKTIPTEDVCVNRENNILVEMEKATSQEMSNECIESGDITSPNEPNVTPAENIFQKKRKKTSKKTTSSQTLSHSSIQPDEITSSNTLRSISTEEASKNNEKETIIEKENISCKIPSNEIIESVDITLTKDRKTVPTEDVCENRESNISVEMQHATSQVLRNESIESGDITLSKTHNTTPAENISQKIRKQTSKKTASSQILTHPSIQPDDIESSNSIITLTNEEVYKNKEPVIEKEKTSSEIPNNKSIESFDDTFTKDQKTISTEDVCENRVNKILVEMENAASHVLSSKNTESGDITSSNETYITPAENIYEKKRKKTLNKIASSQILARPRIQPDDITASKSIRTATSTESFGDNNEKETSIEKANLPSQTLNNKSIEAAGNTFTKDLKILSTEEICKNKRKKMLELRPSRVLKNDIISTNDVKSIPSENLNQNKRNEPLKVKKSTSNQILRHESIKSNDMMANDVCENKDTETLLRKENTASQTIKNKTMDLRDICTKDIFSITSQMLNNKMIESGDVTTMPNGVNEKSETENKPNHIMSYKSLESDDSTISHDLEKISSEDVQTIPPVDVHREVKGEKEITSSQEESHESIESPDTTYSNDLKSSVDVCENNEKKAIMEKKNTSSQILSTESIISDKITPTGDLEIISTASQEAAQQKMTQEITKEVLESEESADKITEYVIAELKLLSPQNMLQEQSQPELDPHVEIAKKLDQGIEIVLGNNIENKSMKLKSSVENRNSIDDKEQKTAALLDSAIEKVLGNSVTTSKSTIEMTAVDNDKSKLSYQPKTTTEHLDFAIDAILGAKNAAKQESHTAEVEEKKIISPTKRKLGILTAEKINSSLEKLLESNRKTDLDHKTAETLNQSIEKILGQRIASTQLNECKTLDATTPSISTKSSPKSEDVTAKKSMNKKYFTDMKIISANVPEALFADDDSDNSNSGENSGPNNLKFFPPILSLDDLLHKKTEQILQIPCCANSDSCNCNKNISDATEEPTIGATRQCLGTPNFAIELEVETSSQSNTNEENSNEANGGKAIKNLSDISDAEAEELPTNLVEANTTNMENFVLSDIGIPIDFNMANGSFPDVMDIMLLDQVQQSIDCVISGNNYVQKWSQESYASQTVTKNLVEKGRDKGPVPIPLPSEQHNICISQILESSSSAVNSPCANTIGIGQEINYGTINPLDEVEVSTNIGFDMVGNVTVEDLLADDGDDLFAFPELDKTRSRSNSYSNDSENYSNSTNEAIENMALTTKIIACDHSYNKEIEEKETNKSSNEQTINELPKPTISLSPNFGTIDRTTPAEVKKSPSLNFTKLKSHPTPYWIKKDDLKTSTPKRSSSFDEQSEDVTPTNALDEVNSSSTLKVELSQIKKKLFYNMPELDLAPSKSKSKSVFTKSDNLSNKPNIPIENSTNTQSHKDAQKIVQSIVESSALKEVVPKRLSIEITEMLTIPAPSPIAQETITTTIHESQVNTEVEQEKSSSRSSTPIEILDTTTPAPSIITQPIITIQSQTNRLQRMDAISNQFQGNNECTSFQSNTLTSSASVNCTPNREPTPTLDEPNKEDILLDDTTEQLSDELVEDTREKNADIISLKRGSTPTMDEPPEKKVCLEESPKQLSSKDDIFDMLKRESPVNVVVCKPIVEEIVTSEDSNEELLSDTLPVQIEEHKKGAKEECNRVDLQDITKETTSTTGENNCIQVQPVELRKDTTTDNKTLSKEAKQIDTSSENLTYSKKSNCAEKITNIIEYKCTLIDTVVNNTETNNKAENESNSLKILNSTASSVKPNVQNSIKICNKPIPNISIAALPKIVKLKDNSTGNSTTSNQESNTNKIKLPAKPAEPEILTKMPTSTNSSKKSPYSAPSSKNTTSPSSSKTPPAPNSRSHPYHHSPNNVKVNRNKYSYQRVATSTEVKYPTKSNNVPNPTQHKQTAKPTPDKKSHQFIPSSGYKQTPTMSQCNSHKNGTNSCQISAANIKLSAADEAELKAKLEAYQKTLPQTKIYKEHKQQQLLLKLQEEKLRLEYLEKEKRRQAQKLMSEAQRLKRKSYSESYETHYKKFAPSSAPNVSTSNSMPPQHRPPHQHSNKQPHNRQRYVNKFGEIEKNVASSRNNKEIVPSKAPLTITTAWEHKSASVDEIIEHLAKMKKS